MVTELLDLNGLHFILSNIIEEIKSSTEDVESLLNKLLKIMERKDDYYYQINHGGLATGFAHDSTESTRLCLKYISLVNVEANSEILADIKEKIIENLESIVRNLQMDFLAESDDVRHRSFYNQPEWSRERPFFISYSHKDDIAKKIINAMRRRLWPFVHFWVDEYNLKRHQQLPKELSDAMDKSSACILLLSKNFFESKWCNEEWQALFMKRIEDPDYRLYVIRIDDIEYPPLLKSQIYTDSRNYPNPHAKVELGKLVSEIADYQIYIRFNTTRMKLPEKSS